MTHKDELSQALQHEFFGGQSRSSLLNVNTKRFVRDCKDDTLESVILEMMDKLEQRKIKVNECFVTSREIIFVL